MESWRKCWREGFVPVLSTDHLIALEKALETDDPRLIQGETCSPRVPGYMAQDCSCEAACSLGFCGWQGDGLDTVVNVEEFFAQTCFAADQRLMEPAGCRWFLNWHDDVPREEMRRELLPEVKAAIAMRTAVRQ